MRATTTKRTEPTQVEKVEAWQVMRRVGAPTFGAIASVYAAAAEAERVLGRHRAREVLRAAAGR